MNVTDDMLMAYADGELPAALHAEVERAIATDPALAGKLEQHRALRARLRAELNSELDEPVPDALRALLREPAAPLAGGANNVVPLRKATRPRWTGREWSALAASLLLGAALGIAVYQRGGAELIGSDGAGMLAQGELSQALSEQLAGAPDAAAPVQIGLSFAARGGDYCRTFSVAARKLAGLACRQQGEWRIRALTALDASAGGGYRQAGSALPGVLSELIEKEMAAAPLDAEQEAAARSSGWQR